MDINEVLTNEFTEYVSQVDLVDVIQQAYNAEVIEEYSDDDGEVFSEAYDDEPRHVRLRWRVPRKFRVKREDKIKVYGAIALASEQWAQSYYPEISWMVKFIKDGEYSTELDYDQIEFQIVFWISYGS